TPGTTKLLFSLMTLFRNPAAVNGKLFITELLVLGSSSDDSSLSPIYEESVTVLSSSSFVQPILMVDCSPSICISSMVQRFPSTSSDALATPSETSRLSQYTLPW